MRALFVAVIYLFAAGLISCTKKNQPAQPEAPSDATFAMIQAQVFDASCSSSSCHSTQTRAGGLSLVAGESYANLVNVDPANEQARAKRWQRVMPGKPDSSFLMKKLTGTGPNEGSLMPWGTSGLSSIKIDAMRAWIKAGASETAHVADAPNLYTAPPESEPAFVPPAAPPPDEGFQVSVGPFYIEPGKEREIYSTVNVDLPADYTINRIVIKQPEGSHHFIVYRWKTGPPPPAGIRDFDPRLPSSFEGILNREFVGGTQTPEITIEFPEGVGIPLPTNVTFDLNSHFVNTNGKSSLKAEVYINFYRAPAGSVIHKAKVLFENNLFIDIPPGATKTEGANWIAGRETHIIALSSHVHRHGKRFKISRIQNNQIGETVYENLEWDNPHTVYFNPPLVIHQGDGLRYEGTYVNDDKPFALRFGFSAEDNEMCIMTGYYY